MSNLKLKPQDRQSIDFAEEERQKSRNLLFNTYNRISQNNELTFKVDEIGGISVQGTALAYRGIWFAVDTETFWLKAGTYTLSNCLGRQSVLKIGLEIRTSLTGTSTAYETNSTKIITFDTDVYVKSAYVYLNAGESSNDTVYPLLQKGAVLYPEYQPHYGEIVHKDTLKHFVNHTKTWRTSFGSDLQVEAGSTWAYHTINEQVFNFEEEGDYLFVSFGYCYTNQFTSGFAFSIDNGTPFGEAGGNNRSEIFNTDMIVKHITKGTHTIKFMLTGRGTMVIPSYRNIGYRIIKLAGV